MDYKIYSTEKKEKAKHIANLNKKINENEILLNIFENIYLSSLEKFKDKVLTKRFFSDMIDKFNSLYGECEKKRLSVYYTQFNFDARYRDINFYIYIDDIHIENTMRVYIDHEKRIILDKTLEYTKERISAIKNHIVKIENAIESYDHDLEICEKLNRMVVEYLNSVNHENRANFSISHSYCLK